MNGIKTILAVGGAGVAYLNHLNSRGIKQARELCEPGKVRSYQRSAPWSNVTVNCKTD